ncbi:MAG TPA: DUF308 domain-containing protein [Solirubrobacteraceae bacterium]|nr:DUF308 domain-containing protein [Solirubrobacteraceae bacterium]
MFIAPGTPESYGRQLTRELAERVARNWWVLLLDGLLLIVAGVLIFSIDWSVRSLSIFIGALFIVQGVSTAFVRGLDRTVQTTNLVTGLLSIAVGVAIIVWPHPGLTAVAIFLGAWLIVMGTLTIAGAFAGRDIIPDWWLWLIIGLLEVPLGVLALADPGATLAALVTVAGIWGVVVGVMYVVVAFEVKRLPHKVEKMEMTAHGNGHGMEASTVARSRTPGVAS